MELGQPHARVDFYPRFKVDFSTHKPIKNLASAQ
jgi:hypothetical protein